jgi:NHL repeat
MHLWSNCCFDLHVYFSKIADSRPKLVAGSSEGYSGHVDGRLRDAKLNHPKGLTMDDRGNIYVADAMNMAIRKISDAGKILDSSSYYYFWKWGYSHQFHYESKV